jgi:AcrR family transcriptional regulator
MPRAGLDTIRVVEEAEKLADEVGIGNVTLAAIAARVGVKVPSLYKHIDGLDALQHLVAVRARAELADVLEEAVASATEGKEWTVLAARYRDWAKEHPGRYPSTLRAADPDDHDDLAASQRAIAAIYGVLGKIGIEDEDAVDATRMLRASLHGFVALEAAGGFGLPRDVDRSYDVMVAALERALHAWRR